ncbi:XerC Integrase [uncultured Caudovirales phage]|uniref:Integrase n=1 Tax=uncultured Caudovirales phage TaxID=2100421 RepID=A0A6J5LYB4_9CAUD|nr:XerC Integrase [uncultured Caudovirales phage]
MPRMRLTDSLVAKLKPTDKDKDYLWDTEVPKLCLLRNRGGTKAWVVFFVRDGKDVRVNLGTPPIVNVQEARKKALEALVAPAPAPVEVAPLKVSKTLLEVAMAYVEDRLPGKPSYEKQPRLLRRALPSWLANKPMDEVTMEDLRKVHRDLAAKSGTANSLVSLLRTVANFAMEKRWISVDPFPGRITPHPKKRRKKALNRDQYKALLEAIRERQGRDDRLQWLALEAIVLTGGRKVEMLSLRHDEINRKAQTITKTSHKTADKVGAKDLPLTPQLLDVVSRVEAWKQRFIETHPDEAHIVQRLRTSPWVFPTPGRRDSKQGYLVNVDDDAQALFDDLEAKGVLPEGFVIHHLRSAFISMAMEQGLKVEVVARMVGHADVNTTLRHYREISTDELAEGRTTISDFFGNL